ncbi:thermonuclease family protein [Shinella sp. H4-D48]|uniref:thermonuclease family protein n=1 Tax=Shinella sp. H4-D48 TaxID=2925841 RepID=UPI001F535B0F|nr:thermonuclease family protein [Shinella sp. H4-D48]UNK37724.1 thermonuclease family protein [Shinella sp. H4-D48]
MTFGQLVAVSMVVAFGGGVGATYLSTEGSVQQTQSSAVAAEVKPVSFRSYTMCSGAKRVHCVVDGDTLWHEGTKIRIADIDTPEVGEPKCSSEAALGARATKRMLQLVNAGPFEFRAWEGRDEDKYGRKLRVLVRDGRSLGDILVSEGLARTWSGRREPWC